MPLSKRQIVTAARWWANAMRSPKFQATSEKERKEGTSIGLQKGEIRAKRRHEDPGEEAAARFEAALIKRLKNFSGADDYVLRVDYDPDESLSEALDEAEIEVGINPLPWKTIMGFINGGVQVSCGYDSPYEDVPLLEA